MKRSYLEITNPNFDANLNPNFNTNINPNFDANLNLNLNANIVENSNSLENISPPRIHRQKAFSSR